MRGSCRCGASYRHVPPGLQARPACHHEPDTKGTLVASNLSKTSPGTRPFNSSGGRVAHQYPCPQPHPIYLCQTMSISKGPFGCGVLFFHHTPCLVDLSALQLSCPPSVTWRGPGPLEVQLSGEREDARGWGEEDLCGHHSTTSDNTANTAAAERATEQSSGSILPS